MPTDGNGDCADPISRIFGGAFRMQQVEQACPPRGACLIIEMERTPEGMSFDRFFQLKTENAAETIAICAFMTALSDQVIESMASKHPDARISSTYDEAIEAYAKKIKESGQFTIGGDPL